MLNSAATKYSEFFTHSAFVAKAMLENPGTTANAVLQTSGEKGVQSLLDAMMDTGHRPVLVAALNSPNLNEKVRQRLEVFLYGKHDRNPPAIFRAKMH